MCGIFGGIGNNLNTGIIRALAIANRERGKQSMGLFDSNGKAIKAGIDPYKALANAEFAAFVNTADRWFLAGHTRHATHGKINDTNAHPFRFGRIIGAHNGIVHTPRDRNYQVDSEYLFDQLNRCDGNYQTAFADIDGLLGIVMV
jgi:glucosamine 6-phosphate synthetase-like amidotransferase/phosphosugar isomerase protein